MCNFRSNITQSTLCRIKGTQVYQIYGHTAVANALVGWSRAWKEKDWKKKGIQGERHEDDTLEQTQSVKICQLQVNNHQRTFHDRC